MPQCPKMDKCPFFNDKFDRMPAIADTLKKNYCLDEYAKCARFRIAEALGPDQVPGDLYPHERAVADDLLKKKAP